MAKYVLKTIEPNRLIKDKIFINFLSNLFRICCHKLKTTTKTNHSPPSRAKKYCLHPNESILTNYKI